MIVIIYETFSLYIVKFVILISLEKLFGFARTLQSVENSTAKKRVFFIVEYSEIPASDFNDANRSCSRSPPKKSPECSVVDVSRCDSDMIKLS